MLVQFNQKENSSPFDSIKRFDAEGNEYWTARDLMGLLGYRDYKRMEDAIQRAIASCQNTGNPCSEHFRAVSAKTNKAGRPLEDYWLTRFACYLTAMNGDSRKSEVAAAQSYFATKAREAEVVIPRQNEQLEIMRLQNDNLKIENDNLRRRESLELRREANVALHGTELAAFIAGADVVHLAPKNVDRTLLVDEYGKVRAINDGVGITELAATFGFGKGVKANNQCRMWMKSIGIEDDEWDNQLTAHYTPKLPRKLLPILQDAFKKQKGNRQLKFGE